MFERICFIILINIIFFARTIRLKYCSDDLPVYHKPPVFKNKWHKRWLQLIAYARIEPQQDHFITTMLQAFTSTLVYLALGANDVSFLAAILFSFNPANNQVSVWISGRWYQFTAIFLLLCMALPYASPLFLYLNSFHPSGIFAPLAFIGSKNWWVSLLLPVFWALRFKRFKPMILHKFKMEAVAEDRKISLNRLIIAIKTYGFYALLCIIPWKLTFYHSFLQSAAGNDIMRKRAYKIDQFFYIGLILIGFLIYSFWHWTPTAWGLLWYSVCIAPYCNLIRMQQEVAERYIFIGSVGLMFSLANLLIGHPILITIFLTMYIIRLWYYIPAFTDDYNLIEYSVIESPGSWYAWHTRALKRHDQGCIREALNMWVMCKLLNPKEFKVLMNIGVMLKIMNKHEEGGKFIDLAEQNIIPGQEEIAKTIIKDAREGKLPICI